MGKKDARGRGHMGYTLLLQPMEALPAYRIESHIVSGYKFPVGDTCGLVRELKDSDGGQWH